MTTKTSDWQPGPTVCRCCLTEGCYKDISTEYFWMGKREVYAELLNDTLNISIAYAKAGPNSNSRLICEPCISRLRDAHDFRRQVLECEKTFMQYLDPGSSGLQSATLTLEEVKVEQVKQEKKLSDDEDFDDRVDFVVNDDTDDDLDDEPLMKLATKVPKKEKEVDLLDLLDSTQITVKRKSTASSSKAKEPAAKKAKKREIVIKPSASKTASKAVAKVGEKKKKGPITIKWTKWTTDEAQRSFGDARDNAAMLLEYSNMCPFQYFQSTFACVYCDFRSPEFGPVRTHSQEHKCKARVLVGMKASAVCKVDVTDLKCEICQEDMTDISTLFEHLIEAHDIGLDRQLSTGVVPYIFSDRFVCPECNQAFDLFHNLNMHMNQHYPNFVCSECGQSFATHQRFKIHLLVIHNKNRALKKYKCTRCNEEFASNYKRRHHMISVHKILPYKCPYCTETFAQYTDRATHLTEVHDKGVEYPCSLCPKIFKHSTSRAKHKRTVHIKSKEFSCTLCDGCFLTPRELEDHMPKHTGEKNHICQLCNKAFGRVKSLRAHVRTHHGNTNFICVHCGKTFALKSILKAHIKTHHSNEDLTPNNIIIIKSGTKTHNNNRQKQKHEYD